MTSMGSEAVTLRPPDIGMDTRVNIDLTSLDSIETERPLSERQTLPNLANAPDSRPTLNPASGPAAQPSSHVIQFTESGIDQVPLEPWQVDLIKLCEELYRLMTRYWSIARADTRRRLQDRGVPIGSDKNANNSAEFFVRELTRVSNVVQAQHLVERDARYRVFHQLNGSFLILRDTIMSSFSATDDEIVDCLKKVESLFAKFEDVSLS